MSAAEVYTFVKGRLDGDYVEQTAAFVADALALGIPIGVAFQPGDGTRYDLAFLPLQSLAHAPGRLVEGNRWQTETDFGVSRTPGTALVTWHGHGSAGLDLRSGGFEPTYLGEKFDSTLGSLCALTILFEAIAVKFSG